MPTPPRTDTAGWTELARRLLAFWDARRGGRSMPERKDFDPLDMKPWLSRLMLIEVIDGGRDFRYRLVGTDVTEKLGYEITGKLLSTVPSSPGKVPEFLEEHRVAVRTGRPVHVIQDYFSEAMQRPIKYERLLLPLGERDGKATMLLAYRTDLLEPPES